MKLVESEGTRKSETEATILEHLHNYLSFAWLVLND